LLDPLEEFPLVVPFPEAHLHPSDPGALGLFNKTPNTIDMSLPTPSVPVFTVFTDVSSPTQVHYDALVSQSEVIQPPPAPLIKDMDSFSEGTAQGSFDFTLYSDSAGTQAPPSIAFSPGHPTLSIEIWRDDVVRSTAVGCEERHPCSNDDRHSFEFKEPATKRRRLSILPAGEEEGLMTAPPAGRSQSLPPINFCLMRNGVDPDSLALPLAPLPSPCSAPPTLV